jgi:hypothetical protein
MQNEKLSMDTAMKFLTPGIVFILTLASGLWLSLVGRPYNSAIFNLHKLVALAAVILAAIQLNAALKTVEARVLLNTLIVVAGVCVLALFITGAMMSLGKLNYHLMLTVHRVALALETLALGATVYLLVGAG